MTLTATATQEDGARVYIDAACVTQDVPRIGPALDDVAIDDENREYGDEEGADHRQERAGPSPVSLFLAPLIVNLIFAFVVYFSPALINPKSWQGRDDQGVLVGRHPHHRCSYLHFHPPIRRYRRVGFCEHLSDRHSGACRPPAFRHVGPDLCAGIITGNHRPRTRMGGRSSADTADDMIDRL